MSRFLERRFSVPGPGSTRDVASCSHTWVGRQKEQMSFIRRKPTPEEEVAYRARVPVTDLEQAIAVDDLLSQVSIVVHEPVVETVGVCMFCGAQVRKVGESWERV